MSRARPSRIQVCRSLLVAGSSQATLSTKTPVDALACWQVRMERKSKRWWRGPSSEHVLMEVGMEWEILKPREVASEAQGTLTVQAAWTRSTTTKMMGEGRRPTASSRTRPRSGIPTWTERTALRGQTEQDRSGRGESVQVWTSRARRGPTRMPWSRLASLWRKIVRLSGETLMSHESERER